VNLAHADRLPLLLLPGDTFTGRAPDPVLEQVEHYGDPTVSVNDAFRPVSLCFDRITRPEVRWL
jgi:3D-(3,5/4)-trihydroxycyclohexane-1,2-dione acylhydrolase (decyclizing)